MSWDSMAQYKQAVSGDYNDWHPPIIPFVLKIFMHAGLDIGELMFLQCILGVFGIRSLSKAVLETLFSHKVSDYLIEAFALLTLLLLISPLTPLLPYLMTLWKDCWLMIIMLWISSIAISSFRINQNPLNVISKYRLFILIILTTFALLVRHNSITMLPIFLLIIWLLSRKNYRYPILISFAPIVLYILFTIFQYSYMNVKQTHPVRSVFVIDLVSLCYENNDICENLKFINQKINFRNLHKFKYGSLYSIRWKGIIDNRRLMKIIKGKWDPTLQSEYLDALYSYPLSIIKIKIKTFSELITNCSPRRWYIDHIRANSFNLKHNDITKSMRIDIRRNLNKVKTGKYSRYISCYHVVWLAVNLIAILMITFLYLKRKENMHLMFIIILFIPLSYYFSYLLAVTGYPFRFMYPSTLMVQIIFINMLIYFIVQITKSVYIRLLPQHYSSSN